MNEMITGFVDRTCPVCGKNFIAAPEHIYKVCDKKVCSWTCMLKGEREIEIKPNMRNKMVDMLSMDGTVIRTFSSAAEAHRLLGYTSKNILLCCRGERNSCCGFKWRYHQS